QPSRKLPAKLHQKTVLRRFALFSFEYRDHNQHRHDPLRNVRLASRTRSRTIAFSTLAQRNGHPDQRRQTRARLGTLTHPWDLHRSSVSIVTAETLIHGVPCAYVKSIPGHLHIFSGGASFIKPRMVSAGNGKRPPMPSAAL